MGASGYRDYFKVLGLERGADADAVKRAFRKLAREYHPDVNPNNKEAEAKFKEISEAYEVLSDPDKRRRYEQFGQYWNQAGGASSGGDVDSKCSANRSVFKFLDTPVVDSHCFHSFLLLSI